MAFVTTLHFCVWTTCLCLKKHVRSNCNARGICLCKSRKTLLNSKALKVFFRKKSVFKWHVLSRRRVEEYQEKVEAVKKWNHQTTWRKYVQCWVYSDSIRNFSGFLKNFATFMSNTEVNVFRDKRFRGKTARLEKKTSISAHPGLSRQLRWAHFDHRCIIDLLWCNSDSKTKTVGRVITHAGKILTKK